MLASTRLSRRPCIRRAPRRCPTSDSHAALCIRLSRIKQPSLLSQKTPGTKRVPVRTTRPARVTFGRACRTTGRDVIGGRNEAYNPSKYVVDETHRALKSPSASRSRVGAVSEANAEAVRIRPTPRGRSAGASASTIGRSTDEAFPPAVDDDACQDAREHPGPGVDEAHEDATRHECGQTVRPWLFNPPGKTWGIVWHEPRHYDATATCFSAEPRMAARGALRRKMPTRRTSTKALRTTSPPANALRKTCSAKRTSLAVGTRRDAPILVVAPSTLRPSCGRAPVVDGHDRAVQFGNSATSSTSTPCWDLELQVVVLDAREQLAPQGGSGPIVSALVSGARALT